MEVITREDFLELKNSIEALRIPKEVFSATEAAEYLRISYDMLTKYARTGIIRSANNGKSRIFKKQWLDAWLEKGGTK